MTAEELLGRRVSNTPVPWVWERPHGCTGQGMVDASGVVLTPREVKDIQEERLQGGGDGLH